MSLEQDYIICNFWTVFIDYLSKESIFYLDQGQYCPCLDDINRKGCSLSTSHQ